MWPVIVAKSLKELASQSLMFFADPVAMMVPFGSKATAHTLATSRNTSSQRKDFVFQTRIVRSFEVEIRCLPLHREFQHLQSVIMSAVQYVRQEPPAYLGWKATQRTASSCSVSVATARYVAVS